MLTLIKQNQSDYLGLFDQSLNEIGVLTDNVSRLLRISPQNVPLLKNLQKNTRHQLQLLNRTISHTIPSIRKLHCLLRYVIQHLELSQKIGQPNVLQSILITRH